MRAILDIVLIVLDLYVWLLIALTSQGHALREKARAVPQAILAASACSVTELSAMKNELVALRDRLNAVLGE